MLPYQQQYLENLKKIVKLSDFFGISAPDFEQWYALQLDARRQMDALKAENSALLSGCLFPRLDDLYTASDADIAALEEFAGALMDWSTNLDCGVYLLIHESLLSMYRFRRDRRGVIKELYMVGMGLYYQGRSLQGIDSEETASFQFRNEMVFTEAGSYLKFFAELDDEETKGYVIRALANIAIATRDIRRRVAVSSRVLQILQDDYYHSLAPSLPWDTYLQRTHQQMSSNRSVLSKGNLSAEELAAVLDSCSVVFKPEHDNESPNIRWLWPYYEMEYSCGFVDLQTTMNRMRRLIRLNPYDQYDTSGLYGNVQLAIYYGRLIRDNPTLSNRAEHLHFLAEAYAKMVQALMTCPREQITSYYYYCICLVFTDYFETEGVASYLSVTAGLMSRVSGPLYLRSRRVGDIMRVYSRAILRSDPHFFDDIDFLCDIADPAQKEQAVADFAAKCGLYHDFGLIKMNLERLCQSRELLESEQRLYELHTISGYGDLSARASTAALADTALGHHAWYDGSGGYPARYVRNASPYRQMTDLTAVVSVLADTPAEGLDAAVADVIVKEGRRFSPLVTSFLTDRALCGEIAAILRECDESACRELYREFHAL